MKPGKSRIDLSVVQDPSADPIGAEIIARSIIEIDNAMKQVMKSGLKRSAIVALIHDRSGIGKRDIEIVLNNLECLRKDWCTC